jgi:hypothetical protein
MWEKNKVKFFDPADALFNHVLDGHILAALANTLGVEDVDKLEGALDCDWRKAMRRTRSQVSGHTTVTRAREAEMSERDVLWENAVLFLQHGVMYRDFGEAVRYGHVGRIEHCLLYFTAWFQASRLANYAHETMHLVACLKRIWSPGFAGHWREHCLVNPSGSTKGFMPDDQLGEYIIREIKDMIHHNASPETMSHLRHTLARLPMVFRDIRENMKRVTGATEYYQHSSHGDSAVDVKYVAGLLLRHKVFVRTAGRCQNEGRTKFDCEPAKDLHGVGTAKIASGSAVRRYKELMSKNEFPEGEPDELERPVEDLSQAVDDG